MSNHEILDFDLLVGRSAPFRGFGEVVEDSRRIEVEFHKDVDQVRRQIRDTFGARLEEPSSTPKELDNIIRELWQTGWDPRVGNLQLFARDLGLLLTEATLVLLKGTLIPRSTSNLIHWSIFWATERVEAFPFHKALKCLTHSDGETMTYFVRGLGHQLDMRRENGS
jgi:hypothetical protein